MRGGLKNHKPPTGGSLILNLFKNPKPYTRSTEPPNNGLIHIIIVRFFGFERFFSQVSSLVHRNSGAMN
jgi:hypothetical protein